MPAHPDYKIPKSPGVSISSESDEKSCQNLLQECEMFQKVNPSLLRVLSKGMTVRAVEKDEVLIKQGERIDGFYLLEKERFVADSWTVHLDSPMMLTLPYRANRSIACA
jgi:hypothetical protein